MKYTKYHIRAIAFTLLFSCNNEKEDKSASMVPVEFKEIKLQLADSLGITTFYLPFRYDTSFIWIHHSDCGKPCDVQKYRFQPKHLPAIKESGWIWLNEPKDSVERFTVSHSSYVPFRNGDTGINMVRHNHLKEMLLSDPSNPPLVFDSIEKINDRYYSIFAMENSDSSYSRKVLAVTTIMSNEIKFYYELLSKRKDSMTDSFIKKSIELIKTIRINKGI